ncbi:MAG: hypothetical protein QOE65_172 [Solirubrobacteraceae bacterium]|nr:hypothetical protein [Solirubrobacteraceae bacterium]
MTAPVKAPKPRHDRFARVVAVVTIATTLLAALIGYAQATASGHGGDAGTDSRRLAIQNFAGSSREGDAAQVQYDRFRLAQEQRRRAANALQQRMFGLSPDRSALLLEERRWTSAAQRTERGSAALAEPGVPALARLGRDGPERDANFPARYFARIESATARRAADRDARDSEGAAWGAKATNYTVMLTMLAVAIYLFGFSLSAPARSMRGFLVGVAGLLAASAGLWALDTALNAPHRASPEAARAFAAGSFSYAIDDAPTAVRQLTRAIQLRPDFAKAYLTRAGAEFEAASPQKLASARSLAPLSAMRRELADLERARALGSQDPGLYLEIGFNQLVVAARSGDRALLGRSLRTSRVAAAAAPHDAIPLTNVALALLAQGHRAEALTTYRRASVVAARTGIALQVTAGALTDLEILATSKLGLGRDRDIAEAKRVLVERAQDGRPVPGRRAVRTPRLESVVLPGYFELAFYGGDVFRDDKDTLAIFWYHRDPGGLGWYVLPEVSQYAYANCDDTNPAEYGNCFDDRAGGGYFVRSVYVGATAPATCLPPGDYRAEVYANGRLLGVSRARTVHRPLQAFADHEVGLAACVPPGWRPSRRALPGLLNGRVSPDGRSGLYAFGIDDRIRATGGPGAFARSRALIDDVVHRFASLFPGRLGPGRDVSEEAFIALSGEFVRLYPYPGGFVIAGSGVDTDGAARVGVVYGSDQRTLIDTFRSFALAG